jgi:hypothetical protein
MPAIGKIQDSIAGWLANCFLQPVGGAFDFGQARPETIPYHR